MARPNYFLTLYDDIESNGMMVIVKGEIIRLWKKALSLRPEGNHG